MLIVLLILNIAIRKDVLDHVVFVVIITVSINSEHSPFYETKLVYEGLKGVYWLANFGPKIID